MVAKLKIFLQSEGCMPGCNWCRTHRGTDDEPFPNHIADAARVAKLLPALKEYYGSRVEVSVMSPWNLRALWDCFRLDITPAKPAWVMGKKKLYEGIPELKDLLAVIDAELAPS
ncbi:hypothetical protein FACS1894187_16920 [Synergistales bacterium]|nr:hypothetical protein FACS1894187_16920 [Synergistales bacterium]